MGVADGRSAVSCVCVPEICLLWCRMRFPSNILIEPPRIHLSHEVRHHHSGRAPQSPSGSSQLKQLRLPTPSHIRKMAGYPRDNALWTRSCPSSFPEPRRIKSWGVSWAYWHTVHVIVNTQLHSKSELRITSLFPTTKMGFGLHKPAGEPGAAWPAIMTMPYWVTEFDDPSPPRLSLIVSILSVGTFVGALLAGYVADKAGRKWGIIISAAIPFNLGVALQTAATSQPMFIAGRAFAGLGVGLVSVQATENRNDSGSYRIPLAVQFAWSLILCFGMMVLPETPRFLVKQGKDTKAMKSLVFLRRLDKDHPALVSEFEEIKGNYEYELSLGTASYLECFRGTIGKRTWTGIGLQCLQQLVGVNFIFYYGTSYFSGQKSLPNAFILSVITNVVNVVTTLPGLYAIDKFGRRPVLLVGALGMGVSQYIVAACGAATTLDNGASATAQFAFICIFIAFFASTFGPGAWVVTGEMFPLKVRAKCLSMTTASNWLFNWLLSFIVPYLTDSDYAGLASNVFWIWGAFCWIAVAFVFFLVYETKDLTLEQVNELYETTGKAWKSKDYRAVARRRSVAHAEEEKGRYSVDGMKKEQDAVAAQKELV
ncbi:Plasma membrane low glucose sensor [Zalaria obscura]|uniref:Plasma membrane low glucose sensor n=1 Tax=Zalaria obscura TaxID=2024903 RepID=A0ACC3SI99_9PEZI